MAQSARIFICILLVLTRLTSPLVIRLAGVWIVGCRRRASLLGLVPCWFSVVGHESCQYRCSCRDLLGSGRRLQELSHRRQLLDGMQIPFLGTVQPALSINASWAIAVCSRSGRVKVCMVNLQVGDANALNEELFERGCVWIGQADFQISMVEPDRFPGQQVLSTKQGENGHFSMVRQVANILP